MIITIILVLAFVSLLAFGGYKFSEIATKPKTFDYEYTYDKSIENEEFDPVEFKKLSGEELKIKSTFGYNLHAVFFPIEGSKKTIILSHGITWSLWGSVKYMEIFSKRDFNVLLYDHRNHGLSGGNNTTFGFYEKQDLKTLVDWVISRTGNDSVIGTHGESLGAATVLQHLGIDKRIAFCIADCPYSDLNEMFKIRLREDYKLPHWPLLPIASLFTKIRTGFFVGDVSPIKDIKKLKTPIFFIHGSQDSYIPNTMSKEMYHAKKFGIKKLYIAPNADHARSLMENRKEYDRKVGDFLNEVGIKQDLSQE